MSDQFYRQFILTGALLLAMASPALAMPPSSPRQAMQFHTFTSEVLLAESWSVGKLVSGGGRTRIVQICAVVMTIALFIMMRKLH
jgi:hypothetical protein